MNISLVGQKLIEFTVFTRLYKDRDCNARVIFHCVKGNKKKFGVPLGSTLGSENLGNKLVFHSSEIQ